MKKFKLEVVYEMSGYIEVEANSLKEAMDEFNENIDDYSLPYDAGYVDGSFRLSTKDVEEMQEIINFINN